jgi:hypothetical protein
MRIGVDFVKVNFMKLKIVFNPVYKKLSKYLKNVKNLKLGKINSIDNETPYKIDGFPTLLLFSHKNKKNPIYYKSKFDFDSILIFLKNNSIVIPNNKNEF